MRVDPTPEHLLTEARAVAGAEYARAESLLTAVGRLVTALAVARGVDEAVIRVEHGLAAPEVEEAATS